MDGSVSTLDGGVEVEFGSDEGVPHTYYYRQLSRGMLTSHNENSSMECPVFEESLGGS